MKNYLLTATTIIIIIVVGLYAQKKDQEQPEITLELIYSLGQYQSAEGNPLPEISRVLNSKAKNILQEDINWVLNKVQLDILRKMQILYSSNGDEIRMSHFGYLPHSNNYKYFIFNTCDHVDRELTNKQAKLMRTDDGSVLWEVSGRMMAYAVISDDGTVTIEQRMPPRQDGIKCRHVDFYNNEGELVKTFDRLISLPMQYTISDNGNIYALLTRDDTGCYCNGFDKFGNILWQTQVPCGHYDDETISFFNNSKYVLYSCYPDDAHTLLIDNSGSVVGHYYLNIKEGTFTSDGKYLVYRVSQDSIHYISIQNTTVYHEMINSGLSPNSEYYFVDLFEKSAEEGVVVVDKEGIIQAIHGKGILVSPNKRLVIASGNIYSLEVRNE